MNIEENHADPYSGSGKNEIILSLKDHNIGFVLPFGSRMEGRLLLAGGALIFGDFVGDIFCESGSVIIKKGGRFRGIIEADRIYVEGEVSSINGEKMRSTLIARKMIAGSSNSQINANIFSESFSLHKAKVWGALRTLEESGQYRKKNTAAKPIAVNNKTS